MLFRSNAFCSLSIGFERSLKLILLFDFALKNAGNMPAIKSIRTFGHDIEALLTTVDSISNLYIEDSSFSFSIIHRNIFKVLNTFSTNSNRYFNFDFATNEATPTSVDPIRDYYDKVTLEVAKIHYKQFQRDKDNLKSVVIESILGNYSTLLHHSESGKPLSSLGDASKNASLVDKTKPWARMYILQIARYIASIISGIETQTYQKHIETIPLASEIFSVFRQSDDCFRRKKNWTIYY